MYLSCIFRQNPAIQNIDAYFRLAECYRNANDRPCQRTLLHIGFLTLNGEQRSKIQRQLNARAEGKGELFFEEDPLVREQAERLWRELIEKKRIDSPEIAREKKKKLLDVDTLAHKDVREIGTEWMCYQAAEQLKIREFLQSLRWSEEQIQLALTQIICRAVYPGSELKTAQRIQSGSGICEITGFPREQITKDRLYKSALSLWNVKDKLERHLSRRTNELFDVQDKIILYDLTNTYFEGRKEESAWAQFGRSKEKRSDCKLIVLALVINMEGFIKYSNVFEGNKSDCKTIPDIVENLRIQTSEQAPRAVVVVDAGIATEENLALIESKGYDYVCVSRTGHGGFQEIEGASPQTVMTKDKCELTVQRVKSDKHKDCFMRVKSPGKALKERSMKDSFESRFEQGLEKLKARLPKKHTRKKLTVINQSIGRLKQRYPSVAKYYDIDVKGNEKGIAIELNYQKNTERHALSKQLSGVYFIRTNLPVEEEQTLWDIYNTIREIESSFRTLKTDLELRPVYHKSDEGTLAHLHLALLAYRIVNTIRYQLKGKGVKHNWKELVRRTMTQKVIRAYGQNQLDETVCVRRCSDPDAEASILYAALNYKFYPFVRRKFVVHKSVLKNEKNEYLQAFSSA